MDDLSLSYQILEEELQHMVFVMRKQMLGPILSYHKRLCQQDKHTSFAIMTILFTGNKFNALRSLGDALEQLA